MAIEINISIRVGDGLPRPQLTPDLLAEGIIKNFGFCVVPLKADGPQWNAGDAVNALWGTKTAMEYRVIGVASPQDWAEMCAFVDKRWPGFISAERRNLGTDWIPWKIADFVTCLNCRKQFRYRTGLERHSLRCGVLALPAGDKSNA